MSTRLTFEEELSHVSVHVCEEEEKKVMLEEKRTVRFQIYGSEEGVREKECII